MDAITLEPDITSFLKPLTDGEPKTVAVMVTSVDGRATVDGRVGDLTGPADQQILLGAREHAAALVVGGRTVHAEGYDGLLDAEARARREARNLAPEPELVVFTRDSPPLPELWRGLRERYPRGLIVCEGGPTLLGLVIENGLLNQLVLAVTPMIVGDDAQKRLLSHGGALNVTLELLSAAVAGGFVFLRYRLP